MVDPQVATDARVRHVTARWLMSGVVTLAVCATAVAGAEGGAVAHASTAHAHVVPARIQTAGGTSAGHRSPQVSSVSATTTTRPVEPTTVTAPPATTASTSTATPTTPTAPVPATPAPVAPGSTVGDVAALVAQVEATGIAPGPTWTWSFGDTVACGPIAGTNVGTGCTAGAAGSVTTVFAGAPGLLLVAHELANAEVENYAIPALMGLVARAEGGASWSPIDAVASCLVVHFLHAQDGAAGSWACPSGLADVVAAHIHDATFTG